MYDYKSFIHHVYILGLYDVKKRTVYKVIIYSDVNNGRSSDMSDCFETFGRTNNSEKC